MSEGQTQIALELAEHEAAALKSKLEKAEAGAKKMASKLSLYEKELAKVLII